VLTLPLELEEAFKEDLKTYERGKKMPYISSIESIGKAELLSLQLERRVGQISEEVADSIKKLSNEQLERLALDLMDFTNIDGLTNWLQRSVSS
jgi:predicted aldo/keto reductase-like oxidoreductase